MTAVSKRNIVYYQYSLEGSQHKRKTDAKLHWPLLQQSSLNWCNISIQRDLSHVPSYQPDFRTNLRATKSLAQVDFDAMYQRVEV